MSGTIQVDSTGATLQTLLGQVRDGRIQVPEFQREFVLGEEWIRSLLASVSLGYPIGAVTLLQTGNPEVRFTALPVRGSQPSSTEPEWLLLDGQQRVTALYQVLASGQAVPAQDDHQRTVRRWYCLDITAALDPASDRDDAVRSVAETTAEVEWQQCLFPLRLVCGDRAELRRWQHGFVAQGASADAATRERLMDRWTAEVLAAFDRYVVPTIVVGKETARWSVRVHGGPDGRSLSDQYRLRP